MAALVPAVVSHIAPSVCLSIDYIVRACVKGQRTRSSATTETAYAETENAYYIETAIQGHSRSSVVVPIDVAYMTSYYHSIVTLPLSSTVLETSRLVCTFIPIPVFQVELEKGG